MVIDGKKIAEGILENLKKSAKPRGFLAVFFVGENAASDSFIKQKEKIAKELGVDFRLYKFPENITQDGLRKEILKIAEHKTCGGAIIQLPLPSHINRQYVLNAISREKDVDVFGRTGARRLLCRPEPGSPARRRRGRNDIGNNE